MQRIRVRFYIVCINCFSYSLCFTVTSSSRSTELLDDADSAKVKTVDDLDPRLQDALAKTRRVRSLHDRNNVTLGNIMKSLKTTRPLDTQLHNATKTAGTADALAQTTLNKISDSFKDVVSEKENSKHLPKKLDDANRDILQAKKQIDSVNEQLPKLVNTLHNLPAQQKELRHVSAALEDKIKILQQQIALARDVANRIKVGVKFYPNTTLELRNPPNLADLSTSSYISGYFRTNETNGLILYLGNGEGTNLRRTKSVKIL